MMGRAERMAMFGYVPCRYPGRLDSWEKAGDPISWVSNENISFLDEVPLEHIPFWLSVGVHRLASVERPNGFEYVDWEKSMRDALDPDSGLTKRIWISGNGVRLYLEARLMHGI